jgi:cell division protein FtsI/penicillin-binding protein 2
MGGVEQVFNDQIRGKSGQALRINDGLQNAVDRQIVLEPTAGASLELTIDETIQHIAERELRAAVLEHRAASGSVVITDPMTGDILAMANYPTFNPNRPGDVPGSQRRNRATEDIYEPGSTFKVVTAAAAIEEGVLSPSDIIDTAPGVIRVARDRLVDDEHAYGELTFENVIVKSSNVGAIKAGWKIGPERLNRYVHRFGFGEVLTTDFLAASAGKVWPPESLDASALASVSMGYQVSVTALQMTNAVAAVANGGTLFQPRIVRAIIRDGRREELPPVPLRTAVSSATAAALTTIMEGVVERGTGSRAAVAGHQVAGKTGTVQKIINGRYSTSAHTGSFVGFVPSRRPALAILVVIDHPTVGGYYGGVVAAPAFQRIATAALRHLGHAIAVAVAEAHHHGIDTPEQYEAFVARTARQ